MNRTATITRRTLETDITLKLNLDGSGQAQIVTGLGFLDHMLTALAKHSGMDIELRCNSDLQVDDHHTVEDCAIALGQAINQALDERTEIARFAYAYAPLDEALSRCVLDLATRITAVINLDLQREMVGQVACENIPHFFQTLTSNARMTLHLDVLRGENDHHKIESTFKAFALALREAIQCIPNGGASTKGVL